MRKNRSLHTTLLLIITLLSITVLQHSMHPGTPTLIPEAFADVLENDQTGAIDSRMMREASFRKSQLTTFVNASPESATDTPARENERLGNELSWTFGGKAQRGWIIYVPLIIKLIDANADHNTDEFASGVSRWQRSNGLAPSGVIDEKTLLAMTNVWQQRRSRDRTLPTPDRLVTAPASDFWDSSRPEEQRQVERDTYAAYKRLVQAAAADKSLGLNVTRDGDLAPGERRLRIVSAYRSREHQERLRKESPNSGRAGLAVNSPHFTGRALDLYIAGDPVDTKDGNRLLQVNTPVYRWLVRYAEHFGFQPYFYEPWHWEYKP